MSYQCFLQEFWDIDTATIPEVHYNLLRDSESWPTRIYYEGPHTIGESIAVLESYGYISTLLANGVYVCPLPEEAYTYSNTLMVQCPKHRQVELYCTC